MVKRAAALAIAASLLFSAAGPVLAAQQVYVYAVMHPSYGRIGTRTDTIDRNADNIRVESRLRVAVELMGAVLYRQRCDLTEVMQGNRLVSLDSVTDRNGKHLEVHGKAEGDRFIVDGTSGSQSGPATTAPSDPWALEHAGPGTLVYTSTGVISDAQVSGGQQEAVSLNGGPVSLRHFIVDGHNRQEVWLDSDGVPVLFRSFENGTPIDFILEQALTADGADPLLPAKSKIQAPTAYRNK